jgi:hypothetical protein
MTTPFPFVAGAVLTAAELNAITTLPINDQTDDYTLVVGDVGKRVIMNKGTANTVTVDDSIFAAGDTIFIANKGAGTSTITAGAGVTINSASGLDLVTSQSGQLVALSASSFLFVASDVSASAGGLVLISTTTATSGGTVAVSNVFSSTYNSYQIVIDDMLYATGGQVLRMTLGAAATGYYWALSSINYSTGAIGTDFGDNTTSFTIGQGDNTNKGGAIVFLTNPNIASATSVTSLATDPRAAESTKFAQGFLNDSTQYTGFTISAATRTFASVSIKVYGYAQ